MIVESIWPCTSRPILKQMLAVLIRQLRHVLVSLKVEQRRVNIRAEIHVCRGQARQRSGNQNDRSYPSLENNAFHKVVLYSAPALEGFKVFSSKRKPLAPALNPRREGESNPRNYCIGQNS